MMVADTSLVKKNHQIPRIIKQKIAQKLIEKTSMIDIAHQLFISTSTVIRKLNGFHFKPDFSQLPEIMSWDEYAFTKGKMGFIAQDFKKLDIITVLEGRTRTIIRNYFLRYDRTIRCQVKIITMGMFSPYYDLARQLRFRISRLRLIEENLKQVHPLFQTIFKTFLKDKEKIVNALQLPYSNAKLEATNNLIKLIKRNAIGFRNFEKFKNRFSSLSTSKKKGRNSSFLDLS